MKTTMQAEATIDALLKELDVRREWLAKILGTAFEIPETNDRDVWRERMQDAQNVYEAAKIYETAIAQVVTRIDEEGYRQFEDAITRLVEAAPKKADGTSTLARTPAEKLAELELGYVAHKNRLIDAQNDKREGEQWHSIAYQRLDTLREFYKQL